MEKFSLVKHERLSWPEFWSPQPTFLSAHNILQDTPYNKLKPHTLYIQKITIVTELKHIFPFFCYNKLLLPFNFKIYSVYKKLDRFSINLHN